MLQIIRSRILPFLDFSKTRGGETAVQDDETQQPNGPKKPTKTLTLNPNTRTVALDRQHILVIQHNKQDTIPLAPSLRFTVQECLFIIHLIEQTIPKPRLQQKPVPVYEELPIETERKVQRNNQLGIRDIFETFVKLCIHEPGGQRVAMQAALVKLPGLKAGYKLTVTLCGDGLGDETVTYLENIWRVCQKIRSLYPPEARRVGKSISCFKILHYRRKEADLQEIIVTHTIKLISRRVLKWYNRFRSVAEYIVDARVGKKDKTMDTMARFIRLTIPLIKLLCGFLNPHRACTPSQLHPTIRLILAELHKGISKFMSETFPWEANHPCRRELTDYSLFTQMDNLMIEEGFSYDGFIFSKYIRKILEPIVLSRKLTQLMSDWRWKEAFDADVVFQVVPLSTRGSDEQPTDLDILKHGKDILGRVLSKDGIYDVNPSTGFDKKVEKVWKPIQEFGVQVGDTKPSPTHHKLHPECELAERYCQLSTFDFSKIKSQKELDEVEHTPYMFIALSKPPCRGCRTWFLAHAQRVKSSELAGVERPRKLQPLYLTCPNDMDWREITDYNWVAPELERQLDDRIRECMASQLRLQAVNMTGLMSSSLDGGNRL